MDEDCVFGLDPIDSAIIQSFKESDRDSMIVSEVHQALAERGFDLTKKRVRHRLKSLVNYSYLESNLETGISGRYLRFSLKGVTS